MGIIHPSINSTATASNTNNLIVSMLPSQRVEGIQIKVTFQSKKRAYSFLCEKIMKKPILGNTCECETINKNGEMKINIQERGDYRKILKKSTWE